MKELVYLFKYNHKESETDNLNGPNDATGPIFDLLKELKSRILNKEFKHVNFKVVKKA